MIKLLGKVFGTGKVKIYEKRGARKEWTALKEALKAAGIRKIEANAFQKEPGPDLRMLVGQQGLWAGRKDRPRYV